MFEKYIIQNGDNLEIIAKKFNTTTSVIKDINNMDFNPMLRVGSEIIVPQ